MRCALGVASVDAGVSAAIAGILRAAGVEIGEGVDDGVAAETDPRIELEDSALQIVVKRADRRSAELAAELPGVLARKPGEVVKDLVALAGAATRDAISNRAQILNVVAVGVNGLGEIKLRYAGLARTQVEAERNRIPTGIK